MAGRTGSPAIWWNDLRRGMRRKSGTNDGKKYFFQHMPKTAGTSFRYQLYRVFSQNEIFPNLADLHANDGRYIRFQKLQDLPPEFFAEKNLLMGHFPWFAGQHLFGEKPYHLLFLRDPIEQVISLFHHIKQLTAPPGSTDQEVLALIRHHNQQTRFVAGPGIKGPIGQEHIAKARVRLEQADFVGITELYAESIALANKIFDWDLGDPVLLNTRIKPEDEIDPEVMATLIEKNQSDYEVYEIAKERFKALQNKFVQ